MAKQADYAQTFVFDGVIRKLEVFRPSSGTNITTTSATPTSPAAWDGKDFVLLEDVQDNFDLPPGVRFEREDGVALAFTRDSNLQRHVPNRLPACRGTTIYIVSNNNNNKAAQHAFTTPSIPAGLPVSASTTAASSSRPAPSTPSILNSPTSPQPRHQQQLSLSPTSSSAHLSAWARESFADEISLPMGNLTMSNLQDSNSSLSHGFLETVVEELVLDELPAPVSKRLSRLCQSIVINIPEAHPHGIVPPSSQGSLRTVQDSSTAKEREATCGAGIGGNGLDTTENMALDPFELEMAEQARVMAAGIRQEAEGAVIDVLERCKETLVRFALVLSKAEDILASCYSFEHGNGPRFFVILPDLRRKWDATNVLANSHWRLFFLCECGAHTTSAAAIANSRPSNGHDYGRENGTGGGAGGGTNVPILHLADHEGYVIRQPGRFIEKYGPYLLVMLEMLKFNSLISGYRLPGLSTSTSLFAANTSSTSLTLDRINRSISYLEKVTGLDTSRPWDLTEYLKDVKGSDGIDVDNRMLSYLETGKNRNLFANMYRMKTTADRADWVCRNHHSLKFEHAEYQELESTLSSVGARLDYQLSKISVSLISSQHAERLHDAIVKIVGLGFYDLELTISDWNYSPSDLAKLQGLVGQTDIESVRIAMPPSTASPTPPTPGHPPPTASSFYPSPVPDSPSINTSSQDSVDDHSDYSSHYGRSSSRTDSISSGHPSPAFTHTKLPDWAYTYHQQQDAAATSHRSKQRYDDGRTRHTVESAPYALPNDQEEVGRLDRQHYIVRYMFQGNYNVRLDRGAKLHILDVATGTGIWAVEMAETFPQAEVHGVDISPIFPTPESSIKPLPPNVHFQLCNLLDGLPFPDNYFDFVYQRLLVYALTPDQRKQVNTELLRVLKPFGHVQLVESDGLIYNAGRASDMVNMLSLETPRIREVDPKDVQHLKPGLKRAGFSHVNSFNIALPIGDWGGPLGQMSRDNMHGLATIWLKGELGRQSQEECDATLEKIDEECESNQSFYRVWLVVAQKPLAQAISPPQSKRVMPMNSLY